MMELQGVAGLQVVVRLEVPDAVVRGLRHDLEGHLELIDVHLGAA